MEPSVERLRLQNEFAAATAEYVAAFNEQFVALMRNDGDPMRFQARIDEAEQKRKQAKDALLKHYQEHGGRLFPGR